MKEEEYLWNKTGAADLEIERLENALQVFRYDVASNAPLVLPAKIIPFRKELSPSFSSRKVFRFALAFAACAVFVAGLLGIWFQIFSNDSAETEMSSAEIIAPQSYAPFVANEPTIKESNKPVVTKSSYSIAKKLENRKQPNVGKPFNARKVFPAIDFQNKKTVRNIEPVKQIVKLTEEEKYAYERLMLALSITSSKFKLVKDKVEGIEEKTAVRENER